MNISKKEFENASKLILEIESDSVAKSKIYVEEYWKEIIEIEENDLEDSNDSSYITYTPYIGQDPEKLNYYVLVYIKYNWAFDSPTDLWVPDYLSNDGEVNGYIQLEYDLIKLSIDDFTNKIRNTHMVNKLIGKG